MNAEQNRSEREREQEWEVSDQELDTRPQVFICSYSPGPGR